MRSLGLPDFQTAQVIWYLEEYRRNAFGVGAPTNAILQVGGQEPEEFETIVRRYLATAPNMKRNVSGFSRTLRNLMKIMVTPTLNIDRFARAHNFPQISHMRLAVDSLEWQSTHR